MSSGRPNGAMRRIEAPKRHRPEWGFLAPGGALLALFAVLPFGFAIAFSLTNAELLTPKNPKFVGLTNYINLLKDGSFYTALAHNLYFTVVVVPVQVGLALGLALLVNRGIRGRSMFRVVYFLPVVTSIALLAPVWVLLFNGDGLINAMLRAITLGHVSGPNWLAADAWAFPAIMIVCIWAGAGFQMVILLAGLQEISPELYEAADIDGAGAWQKFVHVTVPGLRNTLIFVIVSTTIFAFRLYVPNQVMTQGGPNGSTTTAIYIMKQYGFDNGQVGYGSTIAVVFFLIVVAVSLGQHRLLHGKGE